MKTKEAEERQKAENNSHDIDVDENICYACNEEDPPSNDEDSEMRRSLNGCNVVNVIDDIT